MHSYSHIFFHWDSIGIWRACSRHHAAPNDSQIKANRGKIEILRQKWLVCVTWYFSCEIHINWWQIKEWRHKKLSRIYKKELKEILPHFPSTSLKILLINFTLHYRAHIASHIFNREEIKRKKNNKKIVNANRKLQWPNFTTSSLHNRMCVCAAEQ